MADSGEGRRKGRRSQKNELGEKARGARPSKRRKKVDGRRRVHLIMAIAHPLRRRILRAIHDWGEPCSPAQVARDIGEPLGTVAYHAKVLWRFGAVEAAGERQVRGAVQHFYDSTIEADPPIEALLEETRKVDDGEE